MDKNKETFSTPFKNNTPKRWQSRAELPAVPLAITDTRVAQLLVVLEEIDSHVKKLEAYSDRQLSDLVVDAALACGFSDPAEAQNAIGAILRAIESPQFGANGDS